MNYFGLTMRNDIQVRSSIWFIFAHKNDQSHCSYHVRKFRLKSSYKSKAVENVFTTQNQHIK